MTLLKCVVNIVSVDHLTVKAAVLNFQNRVDRVGIERFAEIPNANIDKDTTTYAKQPADPCNRFATYGLRDPHHVWRESESFREEMRIDEQKWEYD